MGIALGFGIVAGAQAVEAGNISIALSLIVACLFLSVVASRATRVFFLCACVGSAVGSLAGLIHDQQPAAPLTDVVRMPIVGQVISDPQLASGGVWVRFRWSAPDEEERTSRLTLPLAPAVSRHDTIVVHGMIDGPRAEKIYATSVVVTRHARGVERWRNSARTAIASAVDGYVPGSAGALALGLLIGDDSSLTTDQRDELRGAGLSHLTAVSGWNVTFVTAAIGSLLLACGRRGWLAAGLQILALLAFVWLVGGEPPVMRAAIMGVAAIVAARLGRPAHSFTVLLLTAAVMIAVSPEALSSLSFQLSLLATIGVVLGARFTADLPRATQALATPIVTTAIVGIATAPVIALQFGTFTPAMVPANILAAPLAAPATIFAVAVCLASPLPLVAEVFGWLAWFTSSAILVVARVCAGLPYSQVEFAPINPERALMLYAVGLLALGSLLPEGRACARHLSAWVLNDPRPATAAALTLIALLGVAVLAA